MNESTFDTANWIWRKQPEDIPHQYVCFRKEFHSESSEGGELHIAADTDFVAWLNGRELGRGQFSDYPTEKTYTTLPVGDSMRKGRNVICVLAYYCGSEFSTYTKGRAGLIATLQAGRQRISTDGSWKCAQSPAFQTNGLPWLTPQLGFITKFDARHEVDWVNPDFDDSTWTGAEIRAGAVDGFWKSLRARPVPPLLIGGRLEVQVVMQGYLLRAKELETFADTVDHDLMRHANLIQAFEGFETERLPSPPPLGTREAKALKFKPIATPANGCFAIIDLGAESVGLIDIEIEASAGTVVDISHGEHLLDGKVRNKIGCRNFTDRYICADGLNRHLMPFRRVGGRYIQLNITNCAAPVTLRYAGIKPLDARLPAAGTFKCGDLLTERIREVGVRTLELCMHDHYEDCPWREQALYSYDSRNQMLYGYYVWGNYDFAAASIDLLGRGIRPDGLLELCAPSRNPMTIPIFSFVWISELHEHWLYAGDGRLFHKFIAQIESMLSKALEPRDDKTGLYRLNPDKKLWNFYEWAPGLSGSKCADDEFHAPYNLYLLEALRSHAAMLILDGQMEKAGRYTRAADDLSAAIDRAFWEPEKSCYATKLVGGRRQEFHEHIQFLAIYNKIVPAGKLQALLESIGKEELVKLTFSAMPYMLRAMMPISPATRQYASELLSKSFAPMILAGATSLWETSLGAADFDGAGSLCHGWSSLPVYHHGAWTLGVRPVEPGFRKFLVSPYPGGFESVKGSIPTPSGFIHVEWRRSGNGLDIIINGPSGLSPLLAPLPEAPISSATYNGAPIEYANATPQ